MDKNETLQNAMNVLDVFYKDTAVMLETLKGILINEYAYEDSSGIGSRVCYEGSNSVFSPNRWNPIYLNIFLKKKGNDVDAIAITILLKQYFNKFVPNEEFFIYGCKFFGLKDKVSNLYWYGKDSIEASYEGYKQTEKDNFVEVEYDAYYRVCKFIKRSLWDMKDRQAVADFAKQVVDL